MSRTATDADEATPSETSAALLRSRTFLTTRLLPDLDGAQTRLDAILAEIAAYQDLRNTLRSLDPDLAQTTPQKGAEEKSKGKVEKKAIAEVGQGILVQTNLQMEKDPLVSLGLGGFYAQLSNRQARAFITKRLEILDRKKDLAFDKVAQIEAHVHLTSTSISQLDNLFRGGSIVDDL
ncbi:uncharacterized protein PFL1_01161 [Pseudozyma flocculosa PF-1]|uniref:Uncharacterized protein n=1 Tax=Pseudozyma flocculosa TaxID=84751 RepID=A0A5C3EVD5_9BASI|nr:uncharacterized protein PFL1_01161 [Pseudozyma flocculosa PF-1]EPQ30972.1 hypothetical protein PFL1_01161 [Pseudozyma flocculosa PF-1]SPO35810.1 uncharacterized protein PSFLO_01281 [Pseudozyma flocculosa]